MIRMTVGSLLWLVACILAPAAAAEAICKESLTGCRLPNGEVNIPESSISPDTAGILRFADGTLNRLPFSKEDRPRTTQAGFDRLTKARAGDLMFSDIDGGALVVVSCHASDLGSKYFHELSDRELEQPERVESKFQRSANGAVPGIIDRIQTGHTYLIQSAESKYALVRVLAIRNRAVDVQYVYQPDGARRFTIPKSPVVEVATDLPESNEAESDLGDTPPPFTLDAIASQRLADAVRIHLANHEKLVQECLHFLALKPLELDKVMESCEVLGKLRAVEAAPTLAALIDVGYSSQAAGNPSSTDPCGNALIAMCIPGAEAAIRQIEQDALNEKDIFFMVKIRRGRLTRVVVGVFGVKVAKMLLEEHRAKATNPAVQIAFQNAIEMADEIASMGDAGKRR